MEFPRATRVTQISGINWSPRKTEPSVSAAPNVSRSKSRSRPYFVQRYRPCCFTLASSRSASAVDPDIIAERASTSMARYRTRRPIFTYGQPVSRNRSASSFLTLQPQRSASWYGVRSTSYVFIFGTRFNVRSASTGRGVAHRCVCCDSLLSVAWCVADTALGDPVLALSR